MISQFEDKGNDCNLGIRMKWTKFNTNEINSH